MRVRPACANIQTVNVNVDEEDTMTSTSTFFIETACVAGISPLGADVVVRRVRAPRVSSRRTVPAGTGLDERFVEQLLATFTDRWEW